MNGGGTPLSWRCRSWCTAEKNSKKCYQLGEGCAPNVLWSRGSGNALLMSWRNRCRVCAWLRNACENWICRRRGGTGMMEERETLFVICGRTRWREWGRSCGCSGGALLYQRTVEGMMLGDRANLLPGLVRGQASHEDIYAFSMILPVRCVLSRSSRATPPLVRGGSGDIRARRNQSVDA